VVDFISGIHLYAATLTAPFERERTGRGRLVEVAMQEAAYATVTSQLHAYFETGKAPPRTGNASHGRVPLNVYPTKDGYVAMNIAVEEHWHNLLRAMGREDLHDDPRYVDNAARVANREATAGGVRVGRGRGPVCSRLAAGTAVGRNVRSLTPACGTPHDIPHGRRSTGATQTQTQMQQQQCNSGTPCAR
jgi:CoA:oxalate CoA-transferase